MAKKEDLRQSIRLQKKLLSANALATMSADIMQRLEHHPRFAEAGVVLLYYSLSDEPDTHHFIEKWGHRKKLLLPVVVGNDLQLRQYTSMHDMHKGCFGISEPHGDNWNQYEKIQLAVIPGVAFDVQFNRLGRGRGYYDRLLSKSEFKQVFKLGVCFDFQKVNTIPHEVHDVKMDAIL